MNRVQHICKETIHSMSVKKHFNNNDDNKRKCKRRTMITTFFIRTKNKSYILAIIWDFDDKP